MNIELKKFSENFKSYVSKEKFSGALGEIRLLLIVK